MSNKKILLISLIITIAILNMGFVVATDTQEINNDKISNNADSNKITQHTTLNNNDKKESNLNNKSKDMNILTKNSNTNSKLNHENNTKTNLKTSKVNNQVLSSTFVINGSALNQMENHTIQNAIDDAKPGDTILINGKNYAHCHFIVNKQLTIISNVGTKMTPCPYNTDVSDSYGLFYISPQANGTIIQGFTLENNVNEIDSYGIFVNEASNVKIINCNISTKYADGIRIKNSDNCIINNSIIKNSTTGIRILNSYNTSITNNIITNNNVTGVYIGEGSSYTSINTNNITNNKNAGVTVYSGDHIYIINNFIAYNRDGDDINFNNGTGIYVNCILTRIEIKGNYIRQNGFYGVLNGPRTTNMDATTGAEYREIIDNNYFIKHKETAVHHISTGDTTTESYVYEGTSWVVYLKHAYLIGEKLCGATLYKAKNIAWNDIDLNLRLSEISQNKKGTYSISIVDVDGNIAKEISSLYVIFYLNKDNDNAEPQEGDTYKIVLMQNGTATVSFNKKEYQSTGNILTACLPGLYADYRNNPYKTFNILDSQIPEDIINTKISVSSMKTSPNSGDYFVAKLTDESGNPLANKLISFTLNSKTYNIRTDSTGVAKLKINLTVEKTYTVIVNFDGDEPYNLSSAKADIIIEKLNQKINTKISVSSMKTSPNSGDYFVAKLTDESGNPLANKLISFTLNSKTYNIRTDSTGVAKLKINLKDEKTYNVLVKFDGEESYKVSSAKSKIIIKKLTQTITSKNIVLVPKTNNYYSITLKDQNNNVIVGKNVKFAINGRVYNVKTNNKGVAKLKISLIKEGTYPVKITSPATTKYKAVTKTNKITITKLKQKIISSNKKFAPHSINYYTMALKDQNNNVIVGKNVKFAINGRVYNVKTNNKGVAKLKISLIKEGTYPVKITSPATTKYKAVTKTNKITITKLKQKIISSNKKYLPKSGKYYTITLKDQNNKLIVSKNVKFTVNGRVYNVKTNNKGVAKLKINLIKEKIYTIKINSPKNRLYKAATKTNKIKIKKGTPKLITHNRTFANKINNKYIVYLKDYKGNALSKGKIKFKINSKVYSTITNKKGIAKLSINIVKAKKYKLIITFLGDIKNKAISKTNVITIKNANNTRFVDNYFSNVEIQKLISESPKNSNIEFLGSKYKGISLNINKALNIYSNKGTKLIGLSGKPVFKINANNVNLSNFNIIANSVSKKSDGIIITKSNNVNILNNTVINSLNSSKIADYNNGSTILPGVAIKILNSKNIKIINNRINSFESGIYNEYSQKLLIRENQIKSNNYGIKYGFGSFNTKIFGNTIKDNIGWYVMDVPEGPRGYGIFLNNSAVNVTINQNKIINNYMGISIDANKSTGIIIKSNTIADNSLEGIRFNAGYDLANNVVEPIIEDNAIYRNAKGPSLMILGEMSANPEGIYGPGQWNDNLKLKIGYNWYGTNLIKTWDNGTGITGIGTMCPRIRTLSIGFNKIESITPGVYIIKFYKNGTKLANRLATFELYATLNRGSNKETEVKFNVVNGIAKFSFDKKYYLNADNKIEISVGSIIKVIDRIYYVIYTQNIPNTEIPK